MACRSFPAQPAPFSVGSWTLQRAYASGTWTRGRPATSTRRGRCSTTIWLSAAPFEEFTRADGLLPSMRRAGSQLLRSVENKHVFADGAEVVITCDFVAPDPVGRSATVEHYHVTPRRSTASRSSSTRGPSRHCCPSELRACEAAAEPRIHQALTSVGPKLRVRTRSQRAIHRNRSHWRCRC